MSHLTDFFASIFNRDDFRLIQDYHQGRNQEVWATRTSHGYSSTQRELHAVTGGSVAVGIMTIGAALALVRNGNITVGFGIFAIGLLYARYQLYAVAHSDDTYAAPLNYNPLTYRQLQIPPAPIALPNNPAANEGEGIPRNDEGADENMRLINRSAPNDSPLNTARSSDRRAVSTVLQADAPTPMADAPTPTTPSAPDTPSSPTSRPW